MWNSTDSEPHVLAHKTDVLTRHCETVGRDAGDIRKTVGLSADPFTDVDRYLKRLEQYAELGIGMINIGPMPGAPDPAGFVQRFVTS